MFFFLKLRMGRKRTRRNYAMYHEVDKPKPKRENDYYEYPEDDDFWLTPDDDEYWEEEEE